MNDEFPQDTAIQGAVTRGSGTAPLARFALRSSGTRLPDPQGPVDFDASTTADISDDDDDFDFDVEDRGVVTEDGLPSDRFFDRELSWLAFNQRVLELAEDETLPLLERANFLAIFASNLDEFFMVRVAGLKRRISTGLAVPTNVGVSPTELYHRIVERAHELQQRHARVYLDSVRPALSASRIEITNWDDLGKKQHAALRERFENEIFPVLMPLAVDQAHPFPYISGLSLNLAVRVWNPKTDSGEFARLKVPAVLPRLVELPDTGDGIQRFPPD